LAELAAPGTWQDLVVRGQAAAYCRLDVAAAA
jgi:hypothetical protein